MKFCIMHEGMMGDKLKNKYQLTLLNAYLADTPTNKHFNYFLYVKST